MGISAMSLLRGYATIRNSLPAGGKGFSIEARRPVKMWKKAAAGSFRNAKSGLAFADMYFFVEGNRQSGEESGLKANICLGMTDFEQGAEKLSHNLALQAWHGAAGAHSVSLGPMPLIPAPPLFWERIGRQPESISWGFNCIWQKPRQNRPDTR